MLATLASGALISSFMMSSVSGTVFPQIFFCRSDLYLSVEDGKADLRDASHLQGKKVIETDDAIKEELGDSKIETACTGPAGDNMVTYASISY
jgi:hypothetical protein